MSSRALPNARESTALPFGVSPWTFDNAARPVSFHETEAGKAPHKYTTQN